jgi:hypothetical protein
MGLQINRQAAFLQQDAVVQGLMPAFDLILYLDIFRQLTCSMVGAIVAVQARLAFHMSLITA